MLLNFNFKDDLCSRQIHSQLKIVKISVSVF